MVSPPSGYVHEQAVHWVSQIPCHNADKYTFDPADVDGHDHGVDCPGFDIDVCGKELLEEKCKYSDRLVVQNASPFLSERDCSSQRQTFVGCVSSKDGSILFVEIRFVETKEEILG